jgi:hypothetical protein
MFVRKFLNNGGIEAGKVTNRNSWFLLVFVTTRALFIADIMIISKAQVTDYFKGTAGEKRRHGWSYWDGR